MTTSRNTTAPWTGRVSIDDTALAVTDHGGPGYPVLYLNGCYADQRHWRRVIAALGDQQFRHVTFDERGRGRSETSADHSFAACLRDIDAIRRHRGLERPILVGWSYGAYLAVHWADQHPDRVSGVVAVDGALPFGLTGAQGQAELRALFHRLRWILPVASRLGLAARMSASQHAEVNIEANEVSAACAPVLERLTCPVRYFLGTGGHLGATADVMERGGATLDPVLARNGHLRISSKVPSNHGKILARDSAAVARAVEEVRALAPDAPGRP